MTIHSVFHKSQWLRNSLTICRELIVTYITLEITPVFTNNMRNIHRRTQTLDRQSFVLEKPKSLALKFWAAFIIQLSKPNTLVSNLEFLENHGVWVPMQHNECINFHVFSRWMARSSRVHDMSIGKEWMSEEAKISKFFQRNLPPDPPRNLHLLGKFFLRLLQSFCHLLKTLWKTLNPLSRLAQCSFVVMEITILMCEWKLYPVYSQFFHVSTRATWHSLKMISD